MAKRNSSAAGLQPRRSERLHSDYYASNNNKRRKRANNNNVNAAAVDNNDEKQQTHDVFNGRNPYELTVKQLKALCRDRKLKVGGRKKEIIERLQSHNNNVEEVAAPAPALESEVSIMDDGIADENAQRQRQSNANHNNNQRQFVTTVPIIYDYNVGGSTQTIPVVHGPGIAIRGPISVGPGIGFVSGLRIWIGEQNDEDEYECSQCGYVNFEEDGGVTCGGTCGGFFCEDCIEDMEECDGCESLLCETCSLESIECQNCHQ